MTDIIVLAILIPSIMFQFGNRICPFLPIPNPEIYEADAMPARI
jgi:hypothetical protein